MAALLVKLREAPAPAVCCWAQRLVGREEVIACSRGTWRALPLALSPRSRSCPAEALSQLLLHALGVAACCDAATNSVPATAALRSWLHHKRAWWLCGDLRGAGGKTHLAAAAWACMGSHPARQAAPYLRSMVAGFSRNIYCLKSIMAVLPPAAQQHIGRSPKSDRSGSPADNVWEAPYTFSLQVAMLI